MAVAAGTRLGPYEILSPLGAGGMGEVYRARDTRLDRTVAVKVLPAHLAQDPERRARFEREARAASALNHPHICTIHDVGQQDGIDYLVMEHLEGETLADRLEKGALPQEQALRIGAEVADALDKAHRAGIVHRDLKPGNVMLTKTGAKLLDFGLARVAEPGGMPGGGLSTFPTQAKPLTEEGSLLGTFQYMAPEQLEGKEADARTDIFALGSLLYEILTGKRAFEGKSQASLIGAILKDEPKPISTLLPMTPPALDRLVRRCLAKDPDERWQSAADVVAELNWIAEGGSQAGVSAPAMAGLGRKMRLAWGLVAVLAVLAAGLGLMLRSRPPAEPTRTALRASLLPPPGTTYGGSLIGIALSPDGRRLAFRALSPDGRNRVWVRSLDSDDARPIEGTDTSVATDMTVPNPFPFWSPDGRWLGFLSDGEVKKVDLSGGRPVTLCAVPGLRGAAWGPGDVILLGVLGGPILRVPAAGPPPPARHQGRCRRVPHQPRLPSRRAALPLRVVDGLGLLESEQPGPDGRLARPGRGTQATAVRPGCPVVLLPDRAHRLQRPGGHHDPAVPAGPPRAERRATHARGGHGRGVPADVDDGFTRYPGARSPTSPGPAGLDRPRRPASGHAGLRGRMGRRGRSLSPDGRHAVATEFVAGVTRLVVFDVVTGTPTTVTSETGSWEQYPAWSPDGNAIAFVGSGAIKVKRQDRGWADETLLPFRGVADSAFVTGWSPDGVSLVGHGGDPSRTWLLSLADNKLRTLIESTAVLRQPIFSPNGRYVAFTSTQSGATEVFVQPYPGPGERRQVSQGGGFSPRFGRDGRELFYLRGDRMLMATAFDARTGTNGRPRALFQTAARSFSRACYDVAPDGRFLFVLDEGAPPPLLIIQNWTALLEPGER